MCGGTKYARAPTLRDLEQIAGRKLSVRTASDPYAAVDAWDERVPCRACGGRDRETHYVMRCPACNGTGRDAAALRDRAILAMLQRLAKGTP